MDTSKTYGTSDPTFALSIDGNPENITQTVGNNNFGLKTSYALSGLSWGGARTVGENVGSYNYSGITNSLSSIQVVNTPKLEINKANLTITGNAISSIYDGVTTYNQLITNAGFTTSGLVNGAVVNGVALNDSVSSVASTFASSITATGVAQAGDAARSIGGALGAGLSNYNITYANSGAVTGSVAKANLTITGGTTTSIYTGVAQTNTYTVTGGAINGSNALGSDSIVITGMGAGLNIGAYNDALSVAEGTGTKLANYNISVVNKGITITSATVSPVVNPFGPVTPVVNPVSPVTPDKITPVETSTTGTPASSSVSNGAVSASTNPLTAFILPAGSAARSSSRVSSGQAESNFVLSSLEPTECAEENPLACLCEDVDNGIELCVIPENANTTSKK
jgi:hypothetical protein